MASLNRVQIIGRVGKDPEIRQTQSGTAIATFSIATSENWKDKKTGEKKEKTEWHRIVCFNDHLVKIIEQYVEKGSQIMIEGKLETRKWVDKNGNDQYTTEIVMKAYEGNLILLSAASDKGGGGRSNREYSPPAKNEQKQNQTQHNYAADLDDDIPF